MSAPSCGWPLDRGRACAEPVAETGQHCGEHRRAAAAAKAAAARAARSRSRPVAAEPPPLADEHAAAIFATLDRHKVAYVVIGGMAAAMWGSDLPRTTDADITPAKDFGNLRRLAGALGELHARLRVEGVPRRDRRTARRRDARRAAGGHLAHRPRAARPELCPRRDNRL